MRGWVRASRLSRRRTRCSRRSQLNHFAADVSDAALSRVFHFRKDRLREQHRCFDEEIELILKILPRVSLTRFPRLRPRGVVDQHFNASAEVTPRFGEHRRDLRRLAHVGFQCERFAASAGDRRNDLSSSG